MGRYVTIDGRDYLDDVQSATIKVNGTTYEIMKNSIVKEYGAVKSEKTKTFKFYLGVLLKLQKILCYILEKFIDFVNKEVCFDNYYANCTGTYKKIVDRG